MTELTIFSSPKSFGDAHIARIQRNAIESWLQLGPQVEVVLFGDEEGIAHEAAEREIRHIRKVERSEYGTPLLSSIFRNAQEISSAPLMAYLNADIIVMPEFLTVARAVSIQMKHFLIVGSRIDLNLLESIKFGEGWVQALRSRLTLEGSLHKPSGSDYFIFPRGIFKHIPPFALGRAGWDNWMVYAGRRDRIPVIDASSGIQIVHQNHDYAHLPGGKPHYRHPESERNVQLAGGSEMIFTLQDTDWCIVKGIVRRKRWYERRLPRSAEAWLYSRLGSGKSSRVVRMLFHPYQSLRSLGSRLLRIA